DHAEVIDLPAGRRGSRADREHDLAGLDQRGLGRRGVGDRGNERRDVRGIAEDVAGPKGVHAMQRGQRAPQRIVEGMVHGSKYMLYAYICARHTNWTWTPFGC